MIIQYKKIFVMIACLSFCSSQMQASWWPAPLTRIVAKALRSLKRHPWITGTCTIGTLATCTYLYKRLMGHRQLQTQEPHKDGPVMNIAPTPTPVVAQQTQAEQLPDQLTAQADQNAQIKIKRGQPPLNKCSDTLLYKMVL